MQLTRSQAGSPPPVPKTEAEPFQSLGKLVHSALRSGFTTGNRLHCAFQWLRADATDCSAFGEASPRSLLVCGPRAAGSLANWRTEGLRPGGHVAAVWPALPGSCHSYSPKPGGSKSSVLPLSRNTDKYKVSTLGIGACLSVRTRQRTGSTSKDEV